MSWNPALAPGCPDHIGVDAIETLFEDAGLDPRRLVAQNRLTPDLVLGTDWSFSAGEQANITAFLARSRAGAAAMFDEITGAGG